MSKVRLLKLSGLYNEKVTPTQQSKIFMLEIASSCCIHDRKIVLASYAKPSLRYSRSKLLPFLQPSVTRYNGRGVVRRHRAETPRQRIL